MVEPPRLYAAARDNFPRVSCAYILALILALIREWTAERRTDGWNTGAKEAMAPTVASRGAMLRCVAPRG